MTTQFVTIDSATCISFPGQEAAEPKQPCAPADRSRLGDGDFFEGKSIAKLAQEQGVGPIKDIRVFAGIIPDDEDVDEMLAEIYRLREP